ncbi:MAG: hypothetical protein ABI833_00205 [Acidobacteriota bacterium]
MFFWLSLMGENDEIEHEVDQFILAQIDTVPHLEALLLVWNSRPNAWGIEEMAHRLFLDSGEASAVLENLARRELIAVSPNNDTWHYHSEPEKDRIVALVSATYRQDLIRLARLIHSKPSAAVREFARAFRFKKERH